MKLFGTDGVRGKAGEFISPFLVLKLAMSLGIYFKKHASTNKILIGKDTRRSGYMIENAMVSGLTAVGYNVIQVGPLPTPAIAFLTESMRCDGGIMISASHNSYEDNGIKFFDQTGRKLNKLDEDHIESIFNDQAKIDTQIQTNKNIGFCKRINDAMGRYIIYIKSFFPQHINLQNLRIVIDAANGSAYKVAPIVFDELGAEVINIASNPDGFNINEECGSTNPQALSKKVLECRADIGFAFDGDADRIAVVDEKGQIVPGDQLIAGLALYLKNQNKLLKNTCVCTTMSNMALENYLKKHHIKVLRSDVGDKNVVELMLKEGLNFGAEESGHIIFPDLVKTGDGLASALQILAFVIESKQKPSTLFNQFKPLPQLSISLRLRQKRPIEAYKGLEKIIQELQKKQIRSVIRNSGTENKIRILLEGEQEQELKNYMEQISEIIKLTDG